MARQETHASISLGRVALRSRRGARKAPLGGHRPSRFWRVREDIPRRLTLPLMALSLLLPLGLWTALHATEAVNPIFLPSPWETLQAGRTMLADGTLISDTAASVSRVGMGFGLALLISIPLGLSMGTFKSVNALFEPFIGFIRYMPATGFVSLLIIWLGLDEAPKIALIFIGTIFFNTLMIANIVWTVPSELIRVAQTLGARNVAVFRKVILPYAVPGIIDAARVNLAAGWNLVVVAELVAASEGLGFRIVRAQRFLHTDQIFAVLIIIGIIGLTTDILLRTARNRLAPWSQD